MKEVAKFIIKKKFTALDDKGNKMMNLNARSIIDAVRESKKNEIRVSVDTREIGSESKRKIVFNDLMCDWNIDQIEKGEYKLTRKEVQPIVEEVQPIVEEVQPIVEEVQPIVEEDISETIEEILPAKKIAKKPVAVVAALCKGVTVKSVKEALEILEERAYEDINTRKKVFQDKITTTFKKGSVKGQVTKLFELLYAHGANQIRGKLIGYVEYIKEEKMYQDYNKDYLEEIDPMVIKISRTRADPVYFKYVVMRKIVEGML